jgi:excisionase family DNA binding protein
VATVTALIRTEELAERLGVSESLIYKLAQQQKIPCYRVGGNWRFDEAEVKGVLRQERQEA